MNFSVFWEEVTLSVFLKIWTLHILHMGVLCYLKLRGCNWTDYKTVCFHISLFLWYKFGRWIVRDVPIAGSHRSPELTPLDIFLWHNVKVVVCTKTFADLQDILNVLEHHLKGQARQASIEILTAFLLKMQVFACYALSIGITLPAFGRTVVG